MSEPSSWNDERREVDALGYRQARVNFSRRFPEAEALRRFDERFDPLGLHRAMDLGKEPPSWSPEAVKFAQDAKARYLASRAAESSSAPLLTPYELGVLLHYDTSLVGERPQLDSDEACAARRRMGPADIGLLSLDEKHNWCVSPRGRAYIDSLLRVPFPEAVWVTRWPQPMNALRKRVKAAADAIEEFRADPDQMYLSHEDAIEAEDTLRAVETVLAAREWQPVETAPTDGTRVHIARYVEGYGWILGIGCYMIVGVVGGWVTTGTGPFGELGLGHPTHWQPFPEPPEL